eukprot:TRINITY_DN16032_c0_g2_i1.p1 TRINITY_DN16032_c0_g2~~TRINITY_DN16032_c0_g2_i1.p1  ORF type:complete len:118 (+),score=4.86 TRINITY_DN16032_c0_g2_i1:159-512(+)
MAKYAGTEIPEDLDDDLTKETKSAYSTAPAHSTAPPAKATPTAGPPRGVPAVPAKPRPPSASGGVKAKALYPFQGQPGELTFNYGDVITIIKQSGEWWEGELNGRKGLLPANYVQLL